MWIVRGVQTYGHGLVGANSVLLWKGTFCHPCIVWILDDLLTANQARLFKRQAKPGQLVGSAQTKT